MQNNSIDNLLISISRLVTVDSAGVAIAEIDLREGGILIGGGNIGKTSILNAIRLFLLPEENFKDSAKKFGFADKEGKFFSNDESFEHYFPSNSSFLILECDNYLGGCLPHCQILYRGSADKLDYRRMFTSLRYEQIRHLFWDASAGKDGIGGRVQELTPTKVQRFLKREDKYFKTLMRKSAIKEVIYANQLLDIDAMRFCLFPLSSTADADVEAFRALVRLLFDMKTGSDTVRLAVANIIESQKKERKDELNFDIDAFIDHNDVLASREQLLKKIENLRPEFESLSSCHQDLIKNKSAESELMTFTAIIQNCIDNDRSVLDSEQRRFKSMEDNVNAVAKTCTEIEDKQKRLEGESETLLRQQKKLNETVQETQLVVNQYDKAETLEMIITGHKEHLADKNRELELKLDAEKRQAELQDLYQTTAELETMASRHQESLSKQEFKLFNQLTVPVWMKLAAINLEVAEANPGRELTSKELHVIEAFTELVKRDEFGYELLGVKLDVISVDSRQSDQIRLNKVLSSLEVNRKRIAEVRAIDKENHFEKIKGITSLKAEIKCTLNEIELLQTYTANTTQLNILDQELKQVESQKQQLKSQLEEKNEALEQERKALNMQNITVANLKSELDKLAGLQVSAKAQIEAYDLSIINLSSLPGCALDINEANLQKLIENVQSKRKAIVIIEEKVRDFVRNQVIEHDEQLMSSPVESELLEHAFRQLELRYQGLDEEFDILRKNFVELKLSVHSIINEMKNNREMVHQFERSINRTFDGVVINDLSKIEAKIKVEARFSDLVSEIEHLDAHSDQKASEQFIDRLKSFSRKFFPDGKAALLTMEQIVSGITYRVKKQGQSGWESKSQSTSTIMLINLKLVEILLGLLRNSACTTHFPLIIDEGASVDSSQFDWLLPNMKQAGFRVLSASTNSASSEIIFKFGQHFRLDAMRTATPYHSARTIAFTGMPDCFTTKESALDREQLDLFGEANE